MPTKLEEQAREAWKRLCHAHIEARDGSPQQLWEEEWNAYLIPAAVFESHFGFTIVEASAVVYDRVVELRLPAHVFEVVNPTLNPAGSLLQTDPLERARMFGVAPLGRVFNTEKGRMKFKTSPEYPSEMRRSDVEPLEADAALAKTAHEDAVASLVDSMRAALALFEVFRNPEAQPAFKAGMVEIAKRFNNMPFETREARPGDLAAIEARSRLMTYPGFSLARAQVIQPLVTAYAPLLVQPDANRSAYSKGWSAVSAAMSEFWDQCVDASRRLTPQLRAARARPGRRGAHHRQQGPPEGDVPQAAHRDGVDGLHAADQGRPDGRGQRHGRRGRRARARR